MAAELERVRAAAVVREQRRATAFDRLPLAALRVDAAGQIIEVNACAREKFPHVVAGGGLLASFGEHRLSEEVGLAFQTGANRTFDVRLFADERRTFHVSVEPLPGDGTSEAIVVVSDVTEAVAYQELRSQFSANVSHELRTPLTGLAGLIEALGDPEIEAVTRARFVERAASEIQRLVALISDVLFLSELEATPAIEGVDACDLCLAVAGGVEALREVADSHRVSVTTLAQADVWVPLSERMATTVVQNLVENAIKYGGAGSQAVVETRVSADGQWVDLVCRDNGPGIAERHLPHIFERFYRADASRSKRLGGTGLGLSIVKHIAERFGGSVEASSREGFGTTVTVRLPVVGQGRIVTAPATREDVSFSSTR